MAKASPTPAFSVETVGAFFYCLGIVFARAVMARTSTRQKRLNREAREATRLQPYSRLPPSFATHYIRASKIPDRSNDSVPDACNPFINWRGSQSPAPSSKETTLPRLDQESHSERFSDSENGLGGDCTEMDPVDEDGKAVTGILAPADTTFLSPYWSIVGAVIVL